MTGCAKCKYEKNEGLVGCEGICSKWFHYSCTGLTNLEFGMLTKSNNLFFLCDICKKKCDILEKKWLLKQFKPNQREHIKN